MNKKIINYILLLLLFLTFFIFYEIIGISNKTINRNFISLDLNNIRNPQIKKFIRNLDNYYSGLLLLVSKSHKEYYLTDYKNHDKLPEEKMIKKTNTFSESIYPTTNIGKEWLRNYGSHASNRFSKLQSINKDNLNKLKIAWKYTIDDEVKNDIQSNVIVSDNKIFIPSYNNKIIALNAKTGKLLWKFDLEESAPRRGMVYLKKDIKNPPRLFFSSYKKLISLNADSGKLIKTFGKNGFARLKRPSITAPAIYKNNLIITTSEPSMEVYDINTGNLLWKFILMEKKNKNRNGGKRYDYSGGNPWGGFSLDKVRGIAYITTGNAGRYFNGVNRPGKNKYANSVIAIDILNKKKLWDFQEVRHDIWNLDIPSPPILGSITRNNKKVDVVIALTKLGNTLVLDRVSGKPIYDFHLKKAPKSKIPGEKTNDYQPSLKIPEPFAKQIFNLNEVTNISKKSKNYILNKIKNHKYGFFQPYELNKKNVQFNYHGGAEWAGGSFNLKDGHLYVSSSNIPWEAEILLLKKKKFFSPPLYYEYTSRVNRLKDENGYPGSKPPWGTITSININNGKIVWQVPFGEYKELSEKNIPITGTENYSGITGTESGILLATGTLDKKFRIFDTTNGEELWSYELPFIGSSPPITYSIDDEQYILINSTGSQSLKSGYPELVNFGNQIIVFKIIDE